ncbi:MAG: hypothetical protein AB7L84_03790 [Acidimicrobiia bacterium]
MAEARGDCASCGDRDVAVAAVRRLYITPEDWDVEGRVEVVDEAELWCDSCRATYPHDLLAPG